MEIFYPDAKIFGQRADHYNFTKEPEHFGTVFPYELLNTEYIEGKGIFQTFKGLQYKKKGCVFPQAILCVNVAKRLFIDGIKFLTQNKKAFVGLLFTTSKQKIAFIDNLLSVYNRSSVQVIDAIAPDTIYMSSMPKALSDMLSDFLIGLGISYHNAKSFARIMSVILQYDNAYYYRALDLFSEINRHSLLNSPASELLRVIELSASREDNQEVQAPKFRRFAPIISVASLIPSVRRSFRQAVQSIRWSDLCYDMSDLYYVLERGDYKYKGLSYDERVKIWNDLHTKQPQQLTINKTTPTT